MAKVDYSLLTPIQMRKLEDMFLAKLQMQGKSKNTISNFRTDFNTFKKFSKENKLNNKYKDFTVNHSKLFLDWLIINYHSSNTVRRKMQSVRIFWGYLKSRKIISLNPFEKLGTAPKVLITPTPSKQKDIEKLWNYFSKKYEDTDDLIKKLTIKRDKVIMLMILFSGMKTCEIGELEISHVYARQNRVVPPRDRDDVVTVPVPVPVMDYIKSYIKECKKIPIKNNVIFFSAKKNAIIHERLSSRGVQEIFKKASDQLNINATPKSLRQACIINWINLDIPDTTMRGWLGLAPDYSFDNYNGFGSLEISYEFIES